MAKDHYGMRDYYNFFCKENPNINITAEKFNKIVSEFNKKVKNHLIDNLIIKLPYRLGKLEIVKKKRGVYIDENGRVVNTKAIDWKATNELWNKDSKMREAKVLIRHNNNHTGGYVFRVNYNKRDAVYKNKTVYFFKPVRNVSRSIKERIFDYSKPKYDTYLKD